MKKNGAEWGFHSCSIPWIIALSEVDPGFAIGASVSTGLGCKMLNYGNDTQKENYLKPTLNGEKISAFGLTEPNAGSDVASLKTKATKTDDGWHINGNKIFITNGNIADYYLVAARTTPDSGHRGISIFIVERDQPGISTKSLNKNCWNNSDTAEIFFDVTVKDDALVGELNKGFYYLMDNLNAGRVQFAAWNYGFALGLFKETVKYVSERETFGKKLSDNQYIQFDLARLKSKLEMVRVYIEHAAKNLTRETASICKNEAAELAEEMARQSRHWHGGYSCTMEYHVGRFASDCYVSELGEGSREVNWMVIWKELEKSFS